MGVWIRFLLLLAALPLLPAHAGEEPGATPIPIWCPAVAEEDTVYTSAPIAGAWRTDLVVVGTSRETEDGRFRVTVEETLFGVPPSPALTLDRGPVGRFIFTFQVSNSGYGSLHYSARRCGGYQPATPANLAGARALAKARFEAIVLSAEAIFTGVLTVDLEDDGRYSVMVTEVLSGTEVKKGETVHSERSWRDYRPTEPVDEGRKVLCFVGGHDGDLLWGPHRANRSPAIRRILPGKLADQVRKVLPKRNSLPVVQLNREGHTSVREVVLIGTIEEALLILTSDCYGARTLASRSLIRRPAQARVPVLAAIRKQLFDLTVKEPDRYRTLARLIRILGGIDHREPQGDLARLAEECLEFLETDPPEAPAPPTEFPSSFRGKRWHPVNRTLLWCLTAIGSERVRSEFGKRLVKLRETAPAGWQPYVTEILERHEVVEVR